MQDCSRLKVCISFNFHNCVHCIFSLYLPCLSNYDDEQELQALESMSFIEEIVTNVRCANTCDARITILDDCNITLDKIIQDIELPLIKQLLADIDFVHYDDLDCFGVGYTYYHERLNHESYSGYYFFLELCETICDFSRCIKHALMHSDHLPVLVKSSVL